MLTDQFEGNIVVIEILAQRFNTIVTSHAICAEGQEVIGREGLIYLQVAVSTGSLMEGRRIPADMTIFAGEGRTVGIFLVRIQFEGN